MKKRLSLILALIMALALASPFAVSAEETGSIELQTVQGNSFDGKTINAYQIFHIAGNAQTGWAYTLHEDFENFEYKGLSGFGLIDYIYSLEDEAAAHGPGIRSLTEALLSYIKENSISRTGFVEIPEKPEWDSPDTTSVTITSLPQGYYLLTGQVRSSDPSSMYSTFNPAPFLALATTDNEDSPLMISPKTTYPYINLNFAEGQSAAVGVGEEIHLVAETTIPLNALAFDNYLFQLQLQLSDIIYLIDSLVIRVGSLEAPIVSKDSYTIKDYIGMYRITFTQDFISANIGKKLYISFAAMLRDDIALNFTLAGSRYGILASIFLNYSTDFYSVEFGVMQSHVNIYTPIVNVYKFTGNLGETHHPLGGDKGVRFAISTHPDAQDGNDFDMSKMLVFSMYYELCQDSLWSGNHIDIPSGRYSLQIDQDSPADARRLRELAPDNRGVLAIQGLPPGTYYLYETAAPAGFSQLAAPQEITITYEGAGPNLSFIISPNTNVDVDNVQISAIAIQNNRSSMFPETGGIGTGVFLIIGSVIMIVSGIALIIWKKKSGKKKCGSV